MTTIYVRALDQVLEATISPRIASGNRETVLLRVDFSEHWDGFAKSAVFYTSKNPVPFSRPLSVNGLCTIPAEVLADECRLFISVQGVNSSTGAIKATLPVKYKVDPGAPPLVISDPTPDVYQELLTAYGSAVNELAVERARIDALLKLEEGSTTGDAELQDVRIDANGVSHGSAGTAVRKQFGAVAQVDGGSNPLQPVLFDQAYYYRGGATAHNVAFDIARYNFVKLSEYATVANEGGASFGIFAKLASPIAVFDSFDFVNYVLLVKSAKKFDTVLAVTYAPAWGGTTIITKTISIEAGTNIIKLSGGNFSNEGHDLFRYVGIYGIGSTGNNFDFAEIGSLEMYLVRGDALAGYVLDLKNHVDELTPKPNVVCWGDSLTAGGGWTERLAALSGLNVLNAGTGGEPSATIMARHGADVMIVDGITIPAGTQPVTIATYNDGIRTEFGRIVRPLLQGGTAHVNPVKIGDIEGTLKWTGSAYNDTTGTWTFTRTVAGDAVTIDRPTAMLTAFDRVYNNRHNIPIVFIGTNDGTFDVADMVNRNKLMIAHAKAEKYIVLGLSRVPDSLKGTYEAEMRAAFGRNFLSLREYLTKYGLADQGLTATVDDNAAIANGDIPPQLLVDTVHYTDATKTAIGNLIYKRCCELEMFTTD